MRSRSIKPGFFQNEELAKLGPEAMVLFAGLWCLADREGRLEDRPARIKALLFPYWRRSVVRPLADLHQSGFIKRYKVGSGEYIVIQSFRKHQNPHQKEAASTIPAPEDEVQAPEEHHASRADSGFLTPHSLTPDCGSTAASPATPTNQPPKPSSLMDQDSGFDEFFALWSERGKDLASDADWGDFRRYDWVPAGFHRQQEILTNARACQGPWYGTPRSWVRNRGWERVANPNAPKTQKLSAIDQMYQDAMALAAKETR